MERAGYANLSNAQKYVVQESHVPYSQRNSINVTNEYSSINAHKGVRESYCASSPRLTHLRAASPEQGEPGANFCDVGNNDVDWPSLNAGNESPDKIGLHSRIHITQPNTCSFL